jgi:hypothetical protein
MSDRLRGLHLHVDGASGAAGDMVLGALLDLGVPRQVIDEALDRVGIGRERLRVDRVVKHGMAAVNVTIATDPEPEVPGQHPHRHHADIAARLREAALEAEVERRALDIFARIARAEAKLHGTTVAAVAFHEVGAIDSIADVVGAAAGLAYLAPRAVTSSPVALGHGQIRTAHGILPVPSPAALEILRDAGGLTRDGGVARELCTPTGAAILAHAVTAWTPMPSCHPVAVGHGAGDADLTDRPNVLRLVLGRPAGAALGAEDTLYRIEANLDDMSPEMCEHAAEALMLAGAVDVWWTPITMKKSRPALLLAALAPPALLDQVVRALLSETTSIGVRFDPVDRRVLEREMVEVATDFGAIPVKVARLDGRVVNAAPEYEACRAAARQHQAPLKLVFAAAQAAWMRTRG